MITKPESPSSPLSQRVIPDSVLRNERVVVEGKHFPISIIQRVGTSYDCTKSVALLSFHDAASYTDLQKLVALVNAS